MNDKRSNKMGRSASKPLPDTNRPRLTALLIAARRVSPDARASMMGRSSAAERHSVAPIDAGRI
jgi:hypothetical protein